MTRWTPSPIWAGEDAFIIGGGSSLANFDFTRLQGKRVIGCNEAYQLGSHIVTYCIFGDASFWRANFDKLEEYKLRGGEVVSCSPSLYNYNLPWVKKMTRIKNGVHTDSLIGWNYSTGAASVNLALSLGAKRAFLLGFDMGRRKEDGKTHWHDNRRKAIPDSSYLRFSSGFSTLYKHLQRYPNFSVFNVTDGESRLPVFSRITFEQFGFIIEPQKQEAQ